MTANPDATREVADAVAAFQADVGRLRAEIGRVIVGHGEVVEGVLCALFCGGHVLLEGVPGLGKTMLVRALGQALGLEFGRVQFTPDLMPADLTGTVMIVDDAAAGRRFEFQPGPLFTNLLLADEINRATPKTQSALLEAMQERSVTVARQTHRLDPPFIVLATQNPLEMEGTYPLPEAQLDRFLLKLRVRYPGRDELREILDRTTSGATAEPARVLDARRVRELSALVLRVPAPDLVKDHVVRIVEATHPASPGATPLVQRYVRYGASPRGAQAMLLAAKYRALVDGRYAPSRDDVAQAAAAALRHRILLNFEGEAEGVDVDRVVAEVTERAGA